jgi:hypothetical protein
MSKKGLSWYVGRAQGERQREMANIMVYIGPMSVFALRVKALKALS